MTMWRGRAWLAEERPILKEVDIFREFSDDQIDRVASLGQRVQISAGQVLGVAGESGYQLYIIMGGRAQLSAQSALGDITVRVAGPGESFPLAALIGSGTLITSVRAMTDMELLAIPCSRLRALCSENSEIGMHIYKEIADVLANRYKRTLRHLATGAEGVLPAADIWANV